MVTPNITFIFLSEVWLMENVKSRYLHHEVAGYHFCGQSVTSLNPVTSKLSVYCCYFEMHVVINEKNISIWRMLLHMDMFYLLICLSLLIFTCFSFLLLQIFIWDSKSIQLQSSNNLFYGATSPFFRASTQKNPGVIHLTRLVWQVTHPIFTLPQKWIV